MTDHDRLLLVQAAHAELLAHARAAVAAAARGELDPLCYVRGVLEEHGQLPPDGAAPSALLAAAYAVIPTDTGPGRCPLVEGVHR